MKVLVDTNILFSAILFEHSRVAEALFLASGEHQIYLTDQNITELREIIARKIPDKIGDIEKLLARLAYEVIPTVSNVAIEIRDPKDQPILNAAILNDLDVVLTGDKDFLSLKLDRPKCLTPGEFLQIYGGD